MYMKAVKPFSDRYWSEAETLAPADARRSAPAFRTERVGLRNTDTFSSCLMPLAMGENISNDVRHVKGDGDG